MAKTAVPPIPFQLTYRTAAALLDVLTGVSVRALREAEQGHQSLMEEWKVIEPFFHHLREYVEKHS